jgi:hypothetical protein
MKVLTTILVMALSSVAAADQYRGPRSDSHYRQPQTQERYQPRNQLADVRLDAGRGRAVIPLPQTNRPLDYLEIRAGRVPVTLVDVEVRLADGRVVNSGDRGRVEPFEGRVIDLPRGSIVTAVTARYRTASHRMPARLQVFGVRDQRAYREPRNYRDRRWTR